MKRVDASAAVLAWFMLFALQTAAPACAWHGAGTQALMIDPVSPMTIYAAAEPATLFKSTDGGVSWQPISLIDIHIFWPLAVNPMTTTTVYAGTDLGLFKSTDGATSWRATGLSIGNVRAMAVDPLAPSTVYAGTESGVFKSVNGGGTWSLVLELAPEPTPEPADTVPPDTSILSAADGTGGVLTEGATTLSMSLTLRFTGADNIGLARFECRLDGAGFSACTSPVTHAGLTAVQHRFDVRAVHTSSNADATATRFTWTVDAAPETTITGAIDGRGKAVANGGTTSSNSITFRLTGTDNETVVGFECRLDARSFTACTSPVTYTGAHTFQVRAVDNNRFRDPSPAAFRWTR
jgi:hypothetical protein